MMTAKNNQAPVFQQKTDKAQQAAATATGPSGRAIADNRPTDNSGPAALQRQSNAAKDAQYVVQRKVYIDNGNASRVTGLKAQKLSTKQKLEELLGIKMKTKDKRHQYLYGDADPRVPMVAQAVLLYIQQHYTVVGDVPTMLARITEVLNEKANLPKAFALNGLVEDMVNEMQTESHWIQDKAMPVMSGAEGGYEAFVANAYDIATTTPNSVVRTKKEDVISSFTQRGQQVNTIAFLNKTPIGVFHNKDRDKMVVPELHKHKYSVPKLKEGVHSHSEDEVIYETLFGDLADMVIKKASEDGGTTITFMISDLTCNHNQITSSKQRKVRSCAENIVKYYQTLKAKNEKIQVQVIYARPYNLNHYSDTESARYELAVLAEQALQLFYQNGIRARAISSFFPPEQVETKVLADPKAYGIEEPRTPESFNPDNTPFPRITKKKSRHKPLHSNTPKGMSITNEEQLKGIQSQDGKPTNLEEEGFFSDEYEQDEFDTHSPVPFDIGIEDPPVQEHGVIELNTWQEADYRKFKMGQQIRILHHHPDISDRIFRLKADYDPSLMAYPSISGYVERVNG